MKNNIRLLCCISLLCVLLPSTASAAKLEFFGDKPVIGPGSSLGTPIAYGASWGQYFVGIGLTDKRRKQSSADGSAVFGFGLGDPEKYIGLETDVSIISLTSRNGDRAGDSGSVSLKLHRWLPYHMGIAVGVENAATWGIAKRAGVKTNGFAVITKILPLNSSYSKFLTVSAGVGNGRFGPIPLTPNALTQKKIGIFGSMGFQFHPSTALVSSWTGRDLNLGFSFVPLSTIPMTINVGRVNVLHRESLSAWVISVGFL
ncbi:hypothetical protein [Mariprofundus sp. EBB-1]|uniref:hypothetical protein n=1 Tax=Mariprofundus sp. EBB-1 TaxID=2650971 RepID=UPI0019124962|nr:hypothetical protein [Mariprofundus sp. EBB-1]